MEYHVGDYVVHENSGVCCINEISDMELLGKGSMKTYYVMSPVFKAGARVCAPIEGSSVRLRPVATPDELTYILDHVGELDIIEEPNDRVRVEKFKETMSEFTPAAMACVVKTVLIRKWMRIASGKKVMATDEKTMAVAGKKLYEEMAFALGKEVTEIQSLFEEKVRESSEVLTAV